MPLELKVTSHHKDLLGSDSKRLFRESGGTIGRGLQNDWILPDANRFISSRHATLDFQSGSYYLADISSNGVYINDEDEPLGKGHPRRLFSGDRLRMGDIEFVVSIDEGEGLDMPAASPANGYANDLELLVPEEPLRTGIQLLDEEEITGDEEFQAAMFGTTKMDAGRRSGNKSASVTTSPDLPVADVSDAAAISDAEKLFAAFLKGAGIERKDIHPAVDPHDVMQNAGEVLQEFVGGISELLASRANLKSMFRLDQTTVLPRHNNPLKIAANSEDSMKQLLVGKAGEYLGPLDSVKEVCRDLKFHQDALFASMASAFKEFADRFDPDELQDHFDRTLNRKPS
jgi:type VI secretion system protein ImpI